MYHIVFKYRQVFCLSKKTSYYIRVKVRIYEMPSTYLLDQDLCRCKEKERTGNAKRTKFQISPRYSFSIKSEDSRV